MAARKKGSKSENRPFRSRAAGKQPPETVSHRLDKAPATPATREMDREERTRRGFKAAIVVLTGLSVVALVKMTVSEAIAKNPKFSLRQVVVHTEGTLTPARIVRASGLTDGVNVLTLSLPKIRAEIQKLAHVQSASVERDRENGRLIMKVVQRQPVAWIECPRLKLFPALSGRGYMLDAEGVVLPCEVLTRSYLALPTIRFEGLSQAEAGAPIPDLQVRAALELLAGLKGRFENDFDQVKRIDIPAPYALETTFADGAKVTFSVDEIDGSLARFDRIRREGKARHWQIATLNLIPKRNVPITFRSEPDMTGLDRPTILLSSSEPPTAAPLDAP